MALGRKQLIHAKRIVIKMGSSLLTNRLVAFPQVVAQEIATLSAGENSGREFVLVTSGAISLGLKKLGMANRPKSLPKLQAAASIGQLQLMNNWQTAFASHNKTIAQLLLTHDDITKRERFLHSRRTLRSLLEKNIIPIINENDAVAVEEIRYGDNDKLAAMIANLVSADALILLTDVEGVLDEEGIRISCIDNIEDQAAPVVSGPKTSVGSGGMATKVLAASIAHRSGVCCVIASGNQTNVIASILAGKDVGTCFSLPDKKVSSRKHWIAYIGKTEGQITVDKGAKTAISEGGKSLLAAGITNISGSFGVGAVVSLDVDGGPAFARGLVGYSSVELGKIKGARTTDIEATLGYKMVDEVIHRSDLVLI